VDGSGRLRGPLALIPDKEPELPFELVTGWPPQAVRTLGWRKKYIYPAGKRSTVPLLYQLRFPGTLCAV